MKIAMLSQTYPPMISGMAVVAQRLAQGMAARGHTVLMLTASDQQHAYRASIDGLTLQHLSSMANPFRVGQRMMIWPSRELAASLNLFSPDVVHLHDTAQMAHITLCHCKKAHIPVVGTIHAMPAIVAKYAPQSLGIRRLTEQALWIYARWLSRRYTRLVTPTQTAADAIYAHTGAMPEAISNGVDTTLFTPAPLLPAREAELRARFKIPAGAPVILHVGRLDAEKGVDFTARSAALAMRQSNAHLLMIGDGRRRRALMQMCRELGIADRSHFPGYITLDDGLPDMYRLGTAFICGSEIETQGLVFLEAAASGLPLLGIDASSIPEIILHEKNGFLVRPGDVQSMGHFLTRLIQSPELGQSMGRAGRKIAETHSVAHMLDSYERIYSAVRRPG